MQFQSLPLLLPCIAGFFWLFAYIIFAPRNDFFRKSKRFIAVLSLFFLFAYISSKPDQFMMLHFTLFEQVCALSIVPSFLSYIAAYRNKEMTGVFFRICCIIPLLHFIIGVESVYIAGYDNSVRILQDSFSTHGPLFPYLDDNGQRAFYACYTYVFQANMFLNFLLFAISFMASALKGNFKVRHIVRFLFAGRKCELIPVLYVLILLILLTVVPVLIIGKGFYVGNAFITTVACIFLALVISLVALIGSAGKVGVESISGLLSMTRFGSGISEFDDYSMAGGFLGDTDSAGGIDEKSDESHSKSDGNDLTSYDRKALLRNVFDTDFEKLMIGGKHFLQRDITLTSVADTLGISKDELSDYMEATYGLSFSNYVNMLRIDFAEQYILDHDDATQKDIANACGFSGASAFNTTFSKITGVTPKIWKDRYAEMSKRKKTT